MKNKLITIAFTGAVVLASLTPALALGQSASTTATTTAQMTALTNTLQQIQALQLQIENLKRSQMTLQTQASTQFSEFATNLGLGSKGDAVLALQALLAANPSIYPEGLITGYFGKSTEKALKRFQKENGLEQAGKAGPKTRQLLNQLMKNNPIAFEQSTSTATSTGSSRPCAAVPPGHLIAPGWLKKNKGDRPIVPPCQTLPYGIQKKLGSTTPPVPATTTPPTYVLPMINVISATSTATTTAYVFWTTNKNTTSEFWYGTTTPLVTASSTKLVDNVFSMSHSHNLSGLMASTTYYYIIKVSDERPNSATSTERSFETL